MEKEKVEIVKDEDAEKYMHEVFVMDQVDDFPRLIIPITKEGVKLLKEKNEDLMNSIAGSIREHVGLGSHMVWIQNYGGGNAKKLGEIMISKDGFKLDLKGAKSKSSNHQQKIRQYRSTRKLKSKEGS